MEKLAVLITGASSGIGKACTQLLSKKGFYVFAGVRNKNDGDSLLEETSGNVKPLLLDVTNQETIDAALGELSENAENNLFALINNAGLAFGGPLEILPLSEIKKLIEVNVVGDAPKRRASVDRQEQRTAECGVDIESFSSRWFADSAATSPEFFSCSIFSTQTPKSWHKARNSGLPR